MSPNQRKRDARRELLIEFGPDQSAGRVFGSSEGLAEPLTTAQVAAATSALLGHVTANAQHAHVSGATFSATDTASSVTRSTSTAHTGSRTR
jgi:hypothetical protein